MTKTIWIGAAVAIVSMPLAGCDMVYGINSAKLVQNSIDEPCIAQALQRTQGVAAVHAQTVLEKGWKIMGSGPSHGSPIRYFNYDIDATRGPTLMILDYGDGKYMVSDTMLSMNARIPKAEMDLALPVMRAAENAVARDCGLDIGAMKHSCDGSQCGDP